MKIKKLAAVVVVLLLLIGIAAYLLLSNIDSIAKAVIEEAGSEVVGTPVTVGSVSIKLMEGSATVRDLSVANPPGFSDRPVIRFGEVTAVVDVGSGVIRRIYTNEPQITVELRGGVSNLEVLNRNISASMGEGTSDKGGGDAAGEDPPVIRIDEVEVQNARATIVLDDGGDPAEVTIRRLRFENLDGTPKEIAGAMLGQLVTQVLAETAMHTLEEKSGEYIEQKQQEVKKKLTNKLKKLLE